MESSMSSSVHRDADIYSLLRQRLEPEFRVETFPSADYGTQDSYCYCVFRGNERVAELRGTFGENESGNLSSRAETVVQRLTGRSLHDATDKSPVCVPTIPSDPMIASRLIPLTTNTTYFNSGRAAFCFLIGRIIQPKRLWLPTYVAGSLVSAALQRLPQTPLHFYTVDRNLDCQFPTNLTQDDAVVVIHYFGAQNRNAATLPECSRVDDMSHMLPCRHGMTKYEFGSLRKTFRIADGGFITGQFNPVYESSRGEDVWLRRQARDWRDLREAENMMDRNWSISDMSSQSVAVLASLDQRTIAAQRLQNEDYLRNNFLPGQPLIAFQTDDIPLLHHRIFQTREERDSVRQFLAARGVFCSIHWPVHPEVLRHRNDVDVSDAIWLSDHMLSIPSADLDLNQMEYICRCAREWTRKP